MKRIIALLMMFAVIACSEDKMQSELQEGLGYHLTFKVVQSETGEPIEGVSMVWGIVTYLSPGDFEIETRDVGVTGSDGIVAVDGAKIGHSFKFEKDGYHLSRCLFSSRNRFSLTYPSLAEEGEVSKPTEVVSYVPEKPITVKLVVRFQGVDP